MLVKDLNFGESMVELVIVDESINEIIFAGKMKFTLVKSDFGNCEVRAYRDMNPERYYIEAVYEEPEEAEEPEEYEVNANVRALDYNDSDELWLILVSEVDTTLILFYEKVNFMYAKTVFGNCTVLSYNQFSPNRHIKAIYKTEV